MSLPVRRDPAPHRGFNTKAREVLLDSPKGQFRVLRAANENWERIRTQVSSMRRSGSDEEFLRRVGLIRFHRAESEESDSGTCSPEKKKEAIYGKEEFDGIDDLPKLEKKMAKLKMRSLGEIGKTRSVGDLHKKQKASKSFQQMNIVKLPSAESDEQPIKPPLPIDPKRRTAQYEMQ